MTAEGGSRKDREKDGRSRLPPADSPIVLVALSGKPVLQKMRASSSKIYRKRLQGEQIKFNYVILVVQRKLHNAYVILSLLVAYDQ